MGVALTWCAAALALLPSVVGGEALAALDDRARLAFALAPWLLLAGLPRRTPLNAGFALGLALPTLALAAWLDARGGSAPVALAQRAAWAFACAALVHSAAQRARDANLYGLVWFLAWIAIPAGGALVAAFEGGDGARWTDYAQALSAPARTLVVTADPRIVALDGAALVVSAVLWMLARLRANPSAS